MIKIELEKLLAGKSLYWLSQETGVRWPTLANLLNQKAVRIDFSVLDRICAALKCEPGDLLTRKADRQSQKRGK